jgi:hypothetical protein
MFFLIKKWWKEQEMVSLIFKGKRLVGAVILHFLLVFLSAFKLLLLAISNSHPQSQAPGIVEGPLKTYTSLIFLKTSLCN